MKKIFNIIIPISILLASASCQREQDPFTGTPQIQFAGNLSTGTNFENINQAALFDGRDQATIRAVTFTVNPLVDTLTVERYLVFNLGVDLLLSGPVSEPVNFTISLMSEEDAQFFPGTDTARSANSTAANAITIGGNAATVGATGSIPVGQTSGSVEIRVNWGALIAGAADRHGARNRVYLLLTSDHPSIPASEMQRRIRLNFTRTDRVPAIAAPTFAGASFFFADLNGSVTAQGTSQVTRTGFIYALDTVPRAEFRIGNAAVTQIDSTRTGHTGAFTNRTGALPENTRVWVRAFAINGTDTTYSPALTAAPTSFMTRERSGGTTTIAAPNFTLFRLDTARIIYNLTAVADTFWINRITRALKDTIKETGIVWQTANTPSFLPTSATGTVVGGNLTKMGADTLRVAGFGLTAPITDPTWLIFRPFATNFSGLTEYGPTEAVRIQAPIGITDTASALSDTSAILRGRLQFNGGIALSEAGFLVKSGAGALDWTNNDTIIRVATVPTAAMTHTIGRGLTASTNYRFRAFFRNQFGILVLGEEQSFTTRAAPAP
jgi:hypothetical protein